MIKIIDIISPKNVPGTVFTILFYLTANGKLINCKQITRWQHVSRLKASSFGSW